MKQTWHLMSLSVGTHFLIAHWGFPSFHLGHWQDWLYESIILIGDSDTVIFFVLHWYICLRYLTYWLWWLIRIDRGFRDSYFLCASLIYSFEVLICWLYWLIISYCLAHWSWFCHDYSDHFTCIHSPLYITQFDMLILWLVYPLDRLWAWCIYLSFFFICLSWFVWTWVIYLYFAWLYGVWLLSFCMIACHLPMWVALLSPDLQFSWFRSFLSSRLSLLQVWGLLCAYSLTESKIRSRV